MPKWVRKALVVTFTIFTFGLITPPPALTMEDVKSDDSTNGNHIESVKESQSLYTIEHKQIKTEDPKLKFLKDTLAQAELQSFEKFGTKIAPVIENEFTSIILPKVESVISIVSEQFPEDAFDNLQITEQPPGGISEKIFHIFDRTTGKDVVRFHVRRDNRPKEGYWFNFHYHTYVDNFQEHHQLGDIYWDKNTPPQWLS